MKDVEYYKKLIQFNIGDNFKAEFKDYGSRLISVIVTISEIDTNNVIEEYFESSFNNLDGCYEKISNHIENSSRNYLCYDNYVESFQ